MTEVPDKPTELIRFVRRLLLQHKIEIGLLNIHPETLCEMLNDSLAFCSLDRYWGVLEKDGIEGTVYNIPFKQKVI